MYKSIAFLAVLAIILLLVLEILRYLPEPGLTLLLDALITLIRQYVNDLQLAMT